jgi:hypothetical protein
MLQPLVHIITTGVYTVKFDKFSNSLNDLNCHFFFFCFFMFHLQNHSNLHYGYSKTYFLQIGTVSMSYCDFSTAAWIQRHCTQFPQSVRTSLGTAVTKLDTTITGIYNSITGKCGFSPYNVSIKLYLQRSIGLTLKYGGIVCNLWADR